MRKIWLVCAASALAVLPALFVSVGAQSFSGDADYRNYCASCHGASAKGDGPIAKSMRREPSDLTQLSKKNNGTFPTDQVFRTIDGKNPVSGHGGKDMPVWGDVFSQSRESQTPDMVKARIDGLVKYLEGLQAK